MKMLDLKNAENALHKLVNTDLPVKIAFNLSYVIDKIDAELKRFDDFRIKLVKKYGKETENGFEVLRENSIVFGKDMDELLSTEVDITIPFDISIDLLNDAKFSIIDIKSLIKIGILSDKQEK